MKRLLLAATLFATVALAPAQTFSASLAYDGKEATPVVAAKLRSFTGVFDRPGLDLDLLALTSVGSQLRIGTALAYTARKTIPLSKEFRPRLDLTVGPWINYGVGRGKLSGGLYVGLGWRI